MNENSLLLRQSGLVEKLRSVSLQLPPWLKSLSTPIGVGVAYYLAAKMAFAVGTLSDRIFAPFWPPNIVLFCTLLIAAKRRWWIYLAAVLPAHLIAEMGVGMPLSQNLVAFATNCLLAILSAAGVLRFLTGPVWFATLRDAGIYVVITAGVSPAIAAFGGAFVQIVGGGSMANYWTYWGDWYLANALANVTMAPVVLTWLDSRRHPIKLTTRRKVEGIILVVGLVAACALAFRGDSPRGEAGFLPAVLYSPVPFILWATFRFGQWGATGAILVVTVVSIWENLRELTIFIGPNVETSVLALQVFLLGVGVPVFLLGAAIDELRRSGEATRKLAADVLRAQDEERRRIARELHDSTGQNLVVASLIATRVEGLAPESCAPVVNELKDVLEKAMREVRTVSYLLHPPLLEAGGLTVALSAYLDGFSNRTGIKVDLQMSPDFGRLSSDIELVLFRVTQEALTNVWRHSGSKTAWVRVIRQSSQGLQQVSLSIEDAGKGISRENHFSPFSTKHKIDPTFSGVGLAGMRERLRQVGGRLEIQSGSGRTLIKANVPLTRDT
jgi:signal transduction histidine kinase